MEHRIEADFSSVDKPYVIRSSPLSLWSSFNWSLDDWSRKCEQTLLPFRVHRRDSNCFWETEAIDSFNTYLKYYNQWFRFDANNCENENPFKKYPKSEFWVYSSYNHMERLFGDNPEVMRSLDWTQLGLGSGVDSDARNSTLWIGTEGAFTPCHQDSYGYNFVAQISGKKQWILFPPTDTNNLYPTRIPYEESSVFSSVNLKRPDLRSHPLFRQTSPHIVELSAGDVLFVPPLWWHFVIVTEEDYDKSCISINTWIYNKCFESSLNESVVRLLTTALFGTLSPTQPSVWLNAGADLFTAEEAIHSINLMLKQCISQTKTIESDSNNKQNIPNNAIQIEPSSFEDLNIISFNDDTNKKAKLEESDSLPDISPEAIVNCILHPDVIQLIANKLITTSIDKMKTFQ